MKRKPATDTPAIRDELFRHLQTTSLPIARQHERVFPEAVGDVDGVLDQIKLLQEGKPITVGVGLLEDAIGSVSADKAPNWGNRQLKLPGYAYTVHPDGTYMLADAGR